MRTAIFSVARVSILCVALFGCAHVPGGIAPSTTPLEGRRYTILRRTFGTDSHVALLGVIPLTQPNSVKAAADEAARRVGGDALIEVTVEGYTEWWGIFCRHVIRVDGTAIKFE